MFISKAEKTQIQEALYRIDPVLQQLTEIMQGLNERVGLIEEAITKGYINELKGSQKKPRQGREWTPEQRALASEQMKKIWANKKEKT